MCKFLDDIIYTLGSLLNNCVNSCVHVKQFLTSSTVKQNHADPIYWCVSMKDWDDANRSEAQGPTDFETDAKTSWEKSSSHQDGNPVWTKCNAKPPVRSESEPLADVPS